MPLSFIVLSTNSEAFAGSPPTKPIPIRRIESFIIISGVINSFKCKIAQLALCTTHHVNVDGNANSNGNFDV